MKTIFTAAWLVAKTVHLIAVATLMAWAIGWFVFYQ